MRRSRKILALVLTIIMMLSTLSTAALANPPQWHPDLTPGLQPELVGLARQAAVESIVMLHNENHMRTGKPILPLGNETSNNSGVISVFGRHQIDYFFVGYGSGGDVNFPYSTNLLEAMRRHPDIRVNEELAGIYDAWTAQNPPAHGSWGNWPLHHPEMPLAQSVVDAAANVSDTAVVIIGRSAGEDRETQLSPGSWYLTALEITMLEQVTNAFDNVVVLLNTGNIIDMTWLGSNITGYVPPASAPAVYHRYGGINQDSFKAVLMVWQGGMDAGPAVVDILTGDQTPSGRLHATIANRHAYYPGAYQFTESGGNFWYANYVEDIFVGYRFFETFAPDDVMFEFGFGLSYTEFNVVTNSVNRISVPGHGIPGHNGWPASDRIAIDITVSNVGNHPGKEVLQVYHGAPQGLLDKPHRQLIAYAKTNLLLPGDSETLTITFDINKMASYLDFRDAASGLGFAWIMEAGDYPIFVGTSVRNVTQVSVHNEPATRVVNQLRQALPVRDEHQFARYSIARVDGIGSAPTVPTAPFELDRTSTLTPLRDQNELNLVYSGATDLASMILGERDAVWGQNMPYRQSPVRHQPIAPMAVIEHRLIDVHNGVVSMEDFMAQMTVEELADLTRGGGPMGHQPGVPGNAGVFAGHTERLREFGIPAISAVDGPSGIRMLAPATLIPMATALACTWNDRLVEELYAAVGREMLRNGADTLLAPGVDLQRNPLNGRNFEYFSECPLLNGNMAANASRGAHSQGVATTPKHFTGNNQETNRHGHDSRISERALRELYASAYEMVINTANLQNIMSAYNLVNGVHAAVNYELNRVILREQLGFEGLVMTDWWFGSSHPGAGVAGAGARGNTFLSREFDNAWIPGGGGVGGTTTWLPGGGTNITVATGLPLPDGVSLAALGVAGGGTSTGISGQGQSLRFGYNAARVRSGVDVLMPGDQWLGNIGSGWPGHGINWSLHNPIIIYRAGHQEIGEIQAAARNVLEFAMKSARFRIDNNMPLYDFGPMIPIFQVTQDTQIMPRLLSISLDGVPIEGFEPMVTDYMMFTRSLANLSTVTAVGAGGASVSIIPPVVIDPENDLYATYTIIASLGGLQTIYRVAFTSQPGMPVPPGGTLARLTGIEIDGEPIDTFFPELFNYNVWVGTREAAMDAVVTGIAPSNIDVVVTRVQDDVIRLRALSDHQAMDYFVSLEYFHFAPGMLPQNDEFNDGTTLSDFWTHENQRLELFGGVSDGSLTITSGAGDFWNPPNTTQNWISQPAHGNWTMTTRVSYDRLPFANFHQIGVMVVDGANPQAGVMWRMESNEWATSPGAPQNAPVISFATRTAGVTGAMTARGHMLNGTINATNAVGQAAWPDANPLPATNGYFYMRIVKAGDTYSVYFSRDNITFINAGTTGTQAQRTIPMINPRIGFVVTGGNELTERVSASFDWIRFTNVTPPEAPEGPPPAPVTLINPRGVSRVRMASDSFFMTSELGTEGTTDPETAGTSPNLNVGWSAQNEFILSRIYVEEAGYYDVRVRFAAQGGDAAQNFAQIRIADASPSMVRYTIPGTGGWQNWAWTPTERVHLPAGYHVLQFFFETGGYNVNFVELERLIIPETFSGSNPNVLRAMLDDGDVILSTPGNLGIFTHHSPFVIPEGRTLTVVSTLNVQGGAELIIEGTLHVAPGGRVNNQGGTGGTINIAPDGVLLNDGYVENVTNSTVINNGTITNNDRFEIRRGTTFHVGTVEGSVPLNIHRDAIVIE